MSYKLLGVDLDGTLFDSRKEIGRRSLEALLDAQRRGIVLALVSGRPLCGMKRAAEALHLKRFGGYLLAFNGGVMMECSSERVFRSAVIPSGLAVRFHDFAASNGCAMLAYGDGINAADDPSDPWLRYEAEMNGFVLRKTEDFSEYAAIPLNKFLLGGTPERIEEMQDKARTMFSDGMIFFRSEPFFLECMPKGVDKGTSLDLLASRLKIGRREIMACGDGYNDVAMLEYAGFSVAMANGQPEAMAAADYIAPSSDEDGLADAVERFCR